MNKWNPEANEIFAEVATISDVDERRKFLAAKCGDNNSLRNAVESLLSVYEEAPTFLNDGLIQRDAEVTTDGIGEAIGAMIGPYKLLQKIGEGGFGVVFMAEQKQPVRRKVALKVIKAGMDTREVIARFEAERQALAMMDHPNIAKVFDAGTTDAGRPYFVMELVRGVSITDFCDKNRMGTHDRLSMFGTVCQAVQHAHHKGIIHRDIKPSNIMVTLNDGQPLVKVIDFGVAKAINRDLTEKTLFTSYGQMVGTPQYMSPEQAEMSAMDIDTRSDIYSLGVLLYELLTGSTPLSTESLRAAGLAEIQRMITSEDAPRPSTRLSTLGEELSIVASNRRADPSGLQRLVHGELDWIVMMALDKDRRRRYETAAAFATDIQCYLNNEAVAACPPSAGYRIQKYTSRNRVPIATGAVVGLALILGLIGTTWKAVEAEQQRELATKNATEAEQQRELATEMATKAERQKDVAVQALDRVQDELRWKATTFALNGQANELEQVISEVEVSTTSAKAWSQRVRGIAAMSAGESRKAIDLLNNAIALGDHTVAAYALLVQAYWRVGDLPPSRPFNEKLASMQPKTAEDELFLAYTIFTDDPERAYTLADGVIKKYPTPFALGVRARACEHLGIRTRDLKWFDQGIADTIAESAFTDKAPDFAMWCHSRAIEIGRLQGNQQAVDYHTAAGRYLLEQLNSTESGYGFFYEALGDSAAVKQRWEVAYADGMNDHLKRWYAFYLLSQCDDEGVRRVIGEMNSPSDYSATVDQCRAAILAESVETRAEARDLLLERLTDGSGEENWLGLLHQLGFRDDAVRESKILVKELRASGKPVPPAVKFFAYQIDEQQLRKSAGKDYILRADAYFRIIQRLLSGGQLKRAKEHLEHWEGISCEGNDQFIHLTRMRNLLKNQPDWPHWIDLETKADSDIN